jgi:predicted phage terminase large subunit-like protein
VSSPQTPTRVITGDENVKATRTKRSRLRRQIRRIVRSIRLEGKRLKRQLKALPVPEVSGATVNVDENELAASVCRESFFEFTKEFWSVVSQERPVWNWHIEHMCTEVQVALERIFKGEEKEGDQVTNVPPGTTKSTIYSVMLPAWAWTRMPRFKAICASYSEKLARDDLSLKTRDIVTSDRYRAYFPEVVLRDDQNTKGYFQNTLGGWRYAVGVNGSVTGKHAHAIIIDDPLDPNEAFSEADLKTANRWIKETLSSRKVDKRVTVTFLVMQRLHQDDPTSLFLRRKSTKWTKLPAEVEDGPVPEYLKEKYKDGLLDPVRLSNSVLKEYRQVLGEGAYSSQFRQNPAPPEGAMFQINRLRIGKPPEKFLALVRFWDKAGTADGGNWTVGTLMGKDKEGKFWVLDVKRFRKDSWNREVEIKNTARMDGRLVRVGVEQEAGSGGKESAESTVRNLAGYNVRAIKVDASTGGKKERADPFSQQVNAGNVWLPENLKEKDEWVGWAWEWVEEVRYFPFGRNKDQVDSAALAFSMIAQPRIRVGGWTNCLDEERTDG